MYDAQFKRIAARIDEIETVLALIQDSGREHGERVRELEAELAALEQRLEQIELIASYEPALSCEEM
jgi:vacuolar-type H+-ATPase subunit I/STV1